MPLTDSCVRAAKLHGLRGYCPAFDTVSVRKATRSFITHSFVHSTECLQWPGTSIEAEVTRVNRTHPLLSSGKRNYACPDARVYATIREQSDGRGS